jgi:hypothetical protein
MESHNSLVSRSFRNCTGQGIRLDDRLFAKRIATDIIADDVPVWVRRMP